MKKNFGQESVIQVGIVSKFGGFQADIRVNNGTEVIFAKAEVDEDESFEGKIAAAFTELARKKGILPEDEVFWFDLVDPSNDTWCFARGKEEAFDNILDEVEDGVAILVNSEDTQQALEVITEVEIPDEDAGVDEWRKFIEELGKKVFA